MAHQPARHQKIWKYKLKYGRKVYIVYLRVQENVVMVSKTLRLIFLHFCWLQARHKKWWWWWEKQQSINAFWNLTSISPSSYCCPSHFFLSPSFSKCSINALVSRPQTKMQSCSSHENLDCNTIWESGKTISIVSSMTVCIPWLLLLCTI